MTAVRLAALWVVGALACSVASGAKASTDKPSSESELMSSGLEEKNQPSKDSATKAAIKETSAKSTPKVKVGGYLKPGGGFRYRPSALPKDQYEYGFYGTAGLDVVAKPFKHWTGRLKLQFDSSLFSAVTGVKLFDLEGDGNPDGLDYSTKAVPGVRVREATVRFEPVSWFGIRAGIMRIPFSLQQQSANTGLMFPSRARPNEVFLSGSDFGAQLRTRLKRGILVASVGAYNGDSLGLLVENQTARSVVLSGRLDVNPLGDFALSGGDHEQGPFRFGVGAGLLYHPATLFDERTGTEEKALHDIRISASARIAARGFYFGAEYFRRQQVDDYSSRPQYADGAYAQAAFFVKIIDSFAIEPILRAGFVHEDQSFDPRLTGYTDAGLSLYPVANAPRPSDVRITAQYLGERRFTEEEDAHGGALTLQLRF